eukprot:gnl/TRDRNA2_/TRDRNA2_39621_c0_seq1.p1 gnl/TRDRNA2_/TRDRNA2_39621_c0~~gnl/TRDRNA2_/TRDRNA2_39621_c0_seq1.p1  ORF type:complete len:240 (+),score=35.31 gnl/TRDRNA2_/TRDRNA2_39621_c0_seq1:63-722(+)
MGNEGSQALPADSVALPGQDDKNRCSSDDRASNDSQVFLNVYDLSGQLVGANEVLAGRLKFGGAFHVGVEVYGTEWYYCPDGIHYNQQAPRKHYMHIYNSTIEMGRTAMTQDEVCNLITQYRQNAWTGQKYQCLQNNCCSFANEFCWQLVGQTIPAWVDRIPKLAASLGLSDIVMETSRPSESVNMQPERSQSEPSQWEAYAKSSTDERQVYRARLGGA